LIRQGVLDTQEAMLRIRYGLGVVMMMMMIIMTRMMTTVMMMIIMMMMTTVMMMMMMIMTMMIMLMMATCLSGRDTPIPHLYTHTIQVITVVFVYCTPFLYGYGA
jgi:hypothetical protein